MRDGFYKVYKGLLLFTGVLFSCFIADTGLSAITSSTTYTVHCTTETNS